MNAKQHLNIAYVYNRLKKEGIKSGMLLTEGLNDEFVKWAQHTDVNFERYVSEENYKTIKNRMI